MPSNKSRSLREMAFGIPRRNISPGPPSPTFSEATNASAVNFGPHGPKKIITRSSLKSSTQAFEDLVNTCANYRATLTAMSRATAAFADAMERCSRLKGPTYEASTRLQAASGVHHLIGNQWHVLAETLEKKFEKPLRQHLEAYRTIVIDRSATYERALREKSQIIRDTESRNLNKKERNLRTFREALTLMQRQIDELDELKSAHYQEILEHEEEVWDVVQGKVCIVVRSTMDIFDRVTAKALDPIIEPMLQSVPDPFDAYGPPQSEDQIFSILSPLSMPHAQSSSTPQSHTVSPKSDTVKPPPMPSSNKPSSWPPIGGSAALLPVETGDWPASPQASSPATPTQCRPESPDSSQRKPRMNMSILEEDSASELDDATRRGTHPFGQEWASADSCSHFQDDVYNETNTPITDIATTDPINQTNAVYPDASS